MRGLGFRLEGVQEKGALQRSRRSYVKKNIFKDLGFVEFRGMV